MMEISGLGFRQEILSTGKLPQAGEISSRLIEKRDQDGDGQLSANELGGNSERFSKADLDQDGLLSENEIIKQFESKLSQFGFEPGEEVNIHQLKNKMGMLKSQFSIEGGFGHKEDHLFSLLDSLESSDEDKERLKKIIHDNPFDMLV